VINTFVTKQRKRDNNLRIAEIQPPVTSQPAAATSSIPKPITSQPAPATSATAPPVTQHSVPATSTPKPSAPTAE